MALGWEHDDGTRPNFTRTRIVKVDDSGTQQLVDLRGRPNQKPQKVWHVQPFGETSNPPKDSDGIIVAMGGRQERPLYLDGGHEKYRPKDLPEGGKAIFDHTGDIVRIVKDDMQIKHAKKIVVMLGKGYDAKQDNPDTEGQSIGITMDKDGGVVVSYGGVKITAKSGQAKVEAPVVLVESPDVNLGAMGGKYVKLADDSVATKVKAV